MTPQDWRDLSRVYRAGAEKFNSVYMGERSHAAVLEAQAAECEKIAAEREMRPVMKPIPWEPVTD